MLSKSEFIDFFTSGVARPTDYSSPSSSSIKPKVQKSPKLVALESSISQLEQQLEEKRMQLKLATDLPNADYSFTSRYPNVSRPTSRASLTFDGKTPWRPGHAVPKVFPSKCKYSGQSTESRSSSPRRASMADLVDKKVFKQSFKSGEKKLTSKTGNEIRFSPKLVMDMNTKFVEFNAVRIVSRLAIGAQGSLSSPRSNDIQTSTCPRTPQYRISNSSKTALSKTI